MPHYSPINILDRDVWRTYQKDTFDGAPIGLQVTGKRFEEEKAPGLREAVTTALQDFQDFEPNLA
ncbi:MAG: Acetamidase [Icmadophila ericetorum]|nr:Acetamidase [Icmadophila ericetorum]